MTEQPEIRWVEYDVPPEMGTGKFVRAEHDGPCVFVDKQCSCGVLDIGIVR